MNCPHCGWRHSATLNKTRCVACHKIMHVNNPKYMPGLKLIVDLQKKVTTALTESEWQDICRRATGCVICQDDAIEARVMIVRMKDGGRYNRLNVVPVCGCCSSIYVQPGKSLLGEVKMKMSELAMDNLLTYVIKTYKEEFTDETFDAARIYGLCEAFKHSQCLLRTSSRSGNNIR